MSFTKESLLEFLNQVPPENEIEWFDEERMARYIPYEIVVKKLDYLTDKTWGTSNFQHFFYTLPDNEVRVSGSLDVHLTYRYVDLNGGYVDVVRTLSGAASIFVKHYPDNIHWAASVKSLCLVNSVQVLGAAFGWGLNDNLKPVRDVKKGRIANTISSVLTKKQ